MDAPGHDLGRIIKLSWYATHDDPPVYTHKVNSRLLHEVGFFDHALNGKFAEASGVINIYHPSVTRENVIAWKSFVSGSTADLLAMIREEPSVRGY